MLHAIANIVWLVSPLVLIALGFSDLKHRTGERVQAVLPFAVGIVLLTNWILFIRFVIQSMTPYGMYFRPSWLTAGLLCLSLASVSASLATPVARAQFSIAGALLLTLWVGIGYAPSRFLSRIEWATVSVDDHPVAAAVYLGHPTDMEAEAFALVRLEHGKGNYIFDFDSDKARIAQGSEYVRVPGGVWYLRSMQNGAFVEALRPHRTNEIRMASSSGHVVSVQF